MLICKSFNDSQVVSQWNVLVVVVVIVIVASLLVVDCLFGVLAELTNLVDVNNLFIISGFVARH